MPSPTLSLHAALLSSVLHSLHPLAWSATSSMHSSIPGVWGMLFSSTFGLAMQPVKCAAQVRQSSMTPPMLMQPLASKSQAWLIIKSSLAFFFSAFSSPHLHMLSGQPPAVPHVI